MTLSPPTSAARIPHRVPGASHAFTLFELIVVLSIMTILASVVAPKYAGAVARYRLDSAARRIVADIEQTKVLARASGSTQVISFAPSTHSYSIVGYQTGASRTSDYTVKLNQPPYLVSLQSATFAGMNDLRFGGFGLPADGGTIVVKGNSETRTITVNPISGAVTLQ